jgi:hypothetical protein
MFPACGLASYSLTLESHSEQERFSFRLRQKGALSTDERGVGGKLGPGGFDVRQLPIFLLFFKREGVAPWPERLQGSTIDFKGSKLPSPTLGGLNGSEALLGASMKELQGCARHEPRIKPSNRVDKFILQEMKKTLDIYVKVW